MQRILMVLLWVICFYPSFAKATILAEKELLFYMNECRSDVKQQTIILIDQDNLLYQDRSTIDIIMGSKGETGILGRRSMVDGEEFQILVFRSSKPESFFKYNLKGCSISKRSLSAPPGRDPIDLANDRHVDQTNRIRNSLRALFQQGANQLPIQVNNDAYSMIAKAADTLIIDGEITTRLFIFGNVFLKKNGNIPSDILNGNQGAYPALSLDSTTVHIIGPIADDIQVSGTFEKYAIFWKDLIERSGGWLASFDSAFRYATTAASPAPSNFEKNFKARGIAGPQNAMMKMSAPITLKMTMRNDRINHLIDWLEIFDGQTHFDFPISGAMICQRNECIYDGEILRSHKDISGPQKGDRIRLTMKPKGGYGAIYHNGATSSLKDKVKFELMVVK